jgi:hypothetical protein
MKHTALLVFTPLLLGACSHNPLGEPVWSNWDGGAQPVHALDASAQGPTYQGPSEATGAIAPAPYYNRAPIESQPMGAPTPLQSSSLPPPPTDTGPAVDPYQPHYMSAPSGKPSTSMTQRTQPLSMAGTGAERTSE